jgi:hypothetical protein
LSYIWDVKNDVLISKKYISITLFVVILLCEIYLPSYKVNFALQFLLLVALLLTGKAPISKKISYTLYPLILIFGIGLLGIINSKHEWSFIIKDITYFLKPINAILLSYLLFKSVKDFVLFLKAILFLGCLTAFIHLFGVFVLGDFAKNSINEIRGDFGLDNFIEIFAFFILLFSRKFLGFRLIANKKWFYFILISLLASIYLYFSRTMLVAFFLIGFSMLGYAKITQNTLKIIGLGILLTGLLYAYLFSIKIDRNSKGVEAFLYKIKIAPEEIFKTKIDRENHKELWDHWRGYEANRAFDLMNEAPSSYIIGKGYGSLVNLKFKAPLGNEDMKYISRLHNGYVFVLYKTGIFGLLLLLLFLIALYLKVYRSNTNLSDQLFVNRLISSIGLFYLFTTLIISGIYIPRDAIIFVLGGLLSFDTYNKSTDKIIEQ